MVVTFFFFTTMFNIHKFYVLLTACSYVICKVLGTNNDYIPALH